MVSNTKGSVGGLYPARRKYRDDMCTGLVDESAENRLLIAWTVSRTKEKRGIVRNGRG